LDGGENHDYLRTTFDPILLGAFAETKSGGFWGPVSRNLELAWQEVMGATLGGPSGNRPLVVVLCSANSEDPGHFERSVEHLTNTVRVSTILAPLNAEDLAVATRRGSTAEGNPLFINSLAAHPALEQDDEEDLLWNLLESWTALVPAYEALIRRLLETRESVTVAVVYSDNAEHSALATALLDRLRTFIDQSRLVSVATGSSLEVSDTSNLAALVSNANHLLAERQPQLIVSIGHLEFLDNILPVVEQEALDWPELPFYVLSPSHPLYLEDALGESDVLDRMAGVTFASSPDPEPYDAYWSRLTSMFPGESGLERTENHYDAAYLGLLTAVGASRRSAAPDGADARSVLQSITEVTGTGYEIGPGPVGDVLEAIEREESIHILGTLGPLTFDETGSRASPGSVYCLNMLGGITFDEFTCSDGGCSELVARTHTCPAL
jgi:hypothetical protein